MRNVSISQLIVVLILGLLFFSDFKSLKKKLLVYLKMLFENNRKKGS